MATTPNQTIDSLLLGTTPNPSQSSQFIDRLLAQCGQVTKAAMAIPQDADYTMYMSSPVAVDFQTAISTAKSTVWSSISKLGAATSPYVSQHDITNTVLQDEQYSVVRQCIGDNLETANRNVHLINKYKSNDYNLHTHWNTNQISASFSVPVTNNMSKKMLQRMLNRSDHKSLGSAPAKPQITYNHKVDNSYRPFRPVLRNKPNAIIPLDESILKGSLGPNEVKYPHPYREEILGIEFNLNQVTTSDLFPIKTLQSTPCYWIDTIEDLIQLEHCLKQQTVFSIDVEHHSQHTYQGITCLVQISTLTQDFVIDALVLRDKMSILNSSFTDPRIVKALHGCTMDVLWLQRDLGLYLVNIFDTYQAAGALEFPKRNLASLLDHYCNIKADKSYQLADWRQRPLNREMMVYAREDTHYLLYIYSRMKNELIDRSNLLLQKLGDKIPSVYNQDFSMSIHHYGVIPASNNLSGSAVATENGPLKVPFLLANVLIQSNRIPLLVYEKQNHPVLSARKLFSKLRITESVNTANNSIATSNTSSTTKTTTTMNAETETQQDSNHSTPLLDDNTALRLFTAIFAWRDQKARELDESPGVVLKLDNIIRILRQPPTNPTQLEQLIRPISVFLRPLLVPLFHLIQGVLQLPSDLYHLDVSKLTFSVDGMKDLAEYQTSLLSLEPSLSSNLTASGRSPTGIDTTIGTPANDKIIAGRKGAVASLLGTSVNSTASASVSASANSTDNVKDTKEVGGKKQTGKQTKKKDKQATSTSTSTAAVPTPSSPTSSSTSTAMEDHQGDNYWADDTIAQLEQYIVSNYDKMKYSHPLYFLPDYLHSLIDEKWAGVSDGISANIDDDATKLASADGWGAGLPGFEDEKEKLSRLNLGAAKRVLQFAADQPQQQRPQTKHGINLFSDAVNYDQNDYTSMTGPPLVQMGPEDQVGLGTEHSSLNINPITSERLHQHNTETANNVINQLGFDQCNQLFATPLKTPPTNNANTNHRTDKNLSALALLSSTTTTTTSTIHSAPSSATMGDDSAPSSFINPVAGLKSFTPGESSDSDIFSSLSSPNRNLSGSQNPLFTPAHARIGGKLFNNQQSLEWDRDISPDLIKGTPYGLRGSRNAKDIRVGKMGMDDGQDDEDEAKGRIPEIKSKEMDTPSELKVIYDLVNIKRSTHKKDEEMGDNADGKGDANTVANPFSPSQMLLGQKNYQSAMDLDDADVFAGSEFQNIAPKQHKETNKEVKKEAGKENPSKEKEIKEKPKDKTKDTTAQQQQQPQQQQQQQSKKSASVEAFVVNTTNNPFLTAHEVKDSHSTMYNPSGTKAFDAAKLGMKEEKTKAKPVGKKKK